MSLDLFEREVTERVETAPGFERPEPGAWDGFLRGSAQHTMQGFAKAARSMSMGGAVLPIVYDKFTDGTEAQDRFFKAHEDIFKRAVDYWTPNPGEVGMAGEITGQLLSLLPIVIASPGGAVATTQLSVAEDLMAKGVDPGKAQAVGAVYGAGLGLGIWVPILGKTLPQRMLLGGAGFNVSQGIAMRGVAGEILKGTPAEGDFRMLSPEDLAIDTILGLAFGGLAHLSPAMRAQGDEFWNKVEAWRRNLTPEQIEALGAVRQAQHAAVDSFPGKPRTPEAVDAHVDRVRAAVDQLARDEPVNVADMAPVEATPDRARLDAAGARAAELVREGERVRQEEGLAQPPDIAAEYGHGTRETLLGVRGTPEPGTAEILPGVPRGVSAQGAPEGAQAQPGRLDLTQLPPEHQPRAIGRYVEDALNRIGVAPEEARANASIWEAFFKTAAEHYKIPAARILEQYGLDIRRLGEQEDLPGSLAQSLPGQPRFYSELQRSLEAVKQESASAEQWKGLVKNLKGVKRDEIQWSGLEEWLDLRQGITKENRRWETAHWEPQQPGDIYGFIVDAEGQRIGGLTEKAYATEMIAYNKGKGPTVDKVTKQEVLDFLAGNAVRVEEVLLGGRRAMDEGPAAPNIDTLTDRLSNLGWEYAPRMDDDTIVFHPLSESHPLRAEEMTAHEMQIDERVPQPVRDLAREIELAMRRESGPTKHATYQLPGGENYRELLITLPDKTKPIDRNTLLPTGYHIEPLGRGIGAEWTLVGPDGVGTILRHLQPDAPRWVATEEAIRILRQKGEIAEGDISTQRGTFTGGHWDEPNVLAWLRFNERTDAEGKRVLFVEELQSDWAQQGRKRGFLKEGAEPARQRVRELTATAEAQWPKVRDILQANDNLGFDTTSEAAAAIREHADWRQRWDVTDEIDAGILAEYRATRMDLLDAQDAASHPGEIPRAPFVEKTDAWVGLALKRMIAWAVENGFDRVAWTRGEQQVERWTSALRKHVDAIEWTKTEKGVQLVGYKGRQAMSVQTQMELAGLREAVRRDDPALTVNDRLRLQSLEERIKGNKVVDTTQREDELSDAIGKAMADKILKDPAQSGTIQGENIRVDDTGMHGFYDRILPTVANEVLKKLGGGKVGEIDLHLPAKTDERPPIRPMIDPGPDFEDMPVGAREGAAGAEDFPDGEPPLYSETRIKIGDQVVDVGIIIAKDGIHVVDSDASFELALTFNALGRQQDGRTQDAALTWVTRNWGKPAFWNAMEVITGELPGTKGATAGKQMSFDITPEMIEKAKKGLPLFQAGRGQIQFGDRQTVIGLFENADASTFVHETGHFFLQATKDLASRPTAPEQAVRDWGTLANWLKIEGGEITREQHEQFARGFEKYLAEGKAPTQGLARVFEQFKQWLLAIYHSLSELDVHLTDEVRGVMDRMLGAPEAEGPAGQATGREPPPPRQGAQPAGSAAQRREREPSALLRDIRDLGGINQNQLGEITGETRFGKMKGLPWGVFRPQAKNTVGSIVQGHGLDQVARELRERGWDIPEGDEVRALTEMLSDEIAGARAVRMGEEAEVMTAAALMDHMDEVHGKFTDAEAQAAEQFNFNDKDPRYVAEIARIRKERDKAMAEVAASAEYPLQAEAARVAREKPNLRIKVGEDAQGKAVTVPVREFLEDASRASERAAGDAKLFDAAAACLTGAT